LRRGTDVVVQQDLLTNNFGIATLALLVNGQYDIRARRDNAIMSNVLWLQVVPA
jgi:hypothetical protein